MTSGPASNESGQPARGNAAWSDAELEASVLAYRQLLIGERTNKAATYRELAQGFGRKPEAYERRMQNISAVLADLGKPWIAGLKPQYNIGANVRPRLLRFVNEAFGAEEKVEPPAAVQGEVVALLKQARLSVPAGQVRPQQVTQVVSDFVRDVAVKAWVLKFADGVCECCRHPAPFMTKDALPFLEVHHVTTLAAGGADTIENTVAICPNCHRELHFGREAERIKNLKSPRIPEPVRSRGWGTV